MLQIGDSPSCGVTTLRAEVQPAIPVQAGLSSLGLAVAREREQHAARVRLETAIAGLVPVLMLVFWELFSRYGVVDVRFFSAPSLIVAEMWQFVRTGELLSNLAFTATRIAIGFTIGASIGTTCGLLMGLSQTIRAALYPLISSLYPIPKVTVLPLLLMTFGFSEPSRFLPGALSSLFLTSVSTLGGVIAVKRVHVDVARNMGATPFQIYTTVAIPAALPMIFGGFRLAWGIATVTTVSVELVASNNGLGAMLWNAWEIFAMSQMFVALVTIAAFGLITFALIDFAQSRLMRWKV